MDMHPFLRRNSEVPPPHDEPCVHFLINTKQNRTIASVRMRPSTARMLNDTTSMRVRCEKYVTERPDHYWWDN